MSSTHESKTWGGYINTKEAIPIRQMPIKVVHPQGTTPLQFDNKCVYGILTGIPKQKLSEGMEMRFYWICDRSIEKKFHTHFISGNHNLGYYPKKQHPAKHEITVCPLYVANAATNFNRYFATEINRLQSVCKCVINTNTQRKRVLKNRQKKQTDKQTHNY